MKMLAVAALLVAGCTAGPGTSSATIGVGGAAARATTATPSPTPAPSPEQANSGSSLTPVITTTRTPEDEQLAKLIRAGAADAIPQLQVLNDMDPSKQVHLFEPLGIWIDEQRTGLAALTSSTCTSDAVEIYLDALTQYDRIRKKFLAWKDWGAHGFAYSPAAPRFTVATIEEALAQLDATCPS
jgi:hypothetical protein